MTPPVSPLMLWTRDPAVTFPRPFKLRLDGQAGQQANVIVAGTLQST